MKMQLNLFFTSTAVLKFGNPCKTLKLGTDRVIVKGLLIILFCFNPQFLLDEVSRFLPSHSLKVVAYYYRYFIRPADKATSDSKSEKAVFEMFVRKLPRNRSYLVAAGSKHYLIQIVFLASIAYLIKGIEYISEGVIEKITTTIDYNYLDKFSNEVLNLNKSNRWVGVTNEIGVQLVEKYRKGLMSLLTREENEEYASHTIARHKKRLKFEPKIGPLDYALVKYEKLLRAIIPITNDYYLLVSLDIEEKDFDRIIMEKIIPFIEGEKHLFEVTSGIANK